MFNKKKKGFTLVELLVVIAILAVLATVSILGYSAFVKKATISNDQAIVNQMNIALKTAETSEEKINTVSDAVEIVKEAGFIYGNLTPTTNNYHIKFDLDSKRFYLYGDEKVVYKDNDTLDELVVDKQFKVVHAANEKNDQTFNESIYLYVDYENGEVLEESWKKTINIKMGFDIGNIEEKLNIFYENDIAHDVVFNTNGGVLTVNNKNSNAHQIHYGILKTADITTGNSCFVTHAIIGTLTLRDGKAIADEDGYVCLVKASNGTKIEEVNGGIFIIPEGTSKDDVKDLIVIVEGEEKNLEEIGYDLSAEAVTATKERISSNSFIISNEQQLYQFRDLINAGISIPYVSITEDIDISKETWQPIGTFKNPYHGVIEGNNHKITGLNATAADLDEENWFATSTTKITGAAYGFIGIVGNGDVSISNITFSDVNINISAGNCVGTLIGYAPYNDDFGIEVTGVENSKSGYTKLINGKYYPEDCYLIDGKVIQAKANGIGYGNKASENISINNVKIYGTQIYGGDSVAALIGKAYNTNSLTITNCESDIKINSNGRAAGLCGFANYSTNWNITNNIVKGEIRAMKTAVDKIVLFNLISPLRVIKDNKTNEVIAKYNGNIQEDCYVLTYSNMIDGQYTKLLFEHNGKKIQYSNNCNALCANVYDGTTVNGVNYTSDGNAFKSITTYGNVIINNSKFDTIVNNGIVEINGTTTKTIKKFLNSKDCNAYLNGVTIDQIVNYGTIISSNSTIKTQSNSNGAITEVDSYYKDDNLTSLIVANGKTVKLINCNCLGQITVNNGGSLTIDGGTFSGTMRVYGTLNINNGTFNEQITVGSSTSKVGNLNVLNGVFSKGIYNYVNTHITNGKFTNCTITNAASGVMVIDNIEISGGITNYGNMTIKKGTYQSTDSTFINSHILEINDGNFDININNTASSNETSKLTIKGGTYNKNIINNNNIEINGGVINGTIENKKTFTISDGTFNNLISNNNGTMTINGGKFICESSEKNYAILNISELIINNGDFVDVAKTYCVQVNADAQLLITGGTFTNNSSFYIKFKATNNKVGGTFRYKDATSDKIFICTTRNTTIEYSHISSLEDTTK